MTDIMPQNDKSSHCVMRSMTRMKNGPDDNWGKFLNENVSTYVPDNFSSEDNELKTVADHDHNDSMRQRMTPDTAYQSDLQIFEMTMLFLQYISNIKQKCGLDITRLFLRGVKLKSRVHVLNYINAGFNC